MEDGLSANCRPDVAPRKDPLPMFPPEIGRPEKPRPPTGAYPSQIFGLSLWAPFPKIFWGIFFSGVLGFPDARPVERGRHPVYAGRGPGDPFSDFLDSRSGPLSHFFGLPDALRAASHAFSADAPSHQFAYARRAGGAYHQSRRGRAHAQAQVVLPVSPSRKPLFPSRYRPTGLRLRSGQEQPDRRAQLRRLGSYRLPFWQQSLLVRLARDR